MSTSTSTIPMTIEFFVSEEKKALCLVSCEEIHFSSLQYNSIYLIQSSKIALQDKLHKAILEGERRYKYHNASFRQYEDDVRCFFREETTFIVELVDCDWSDIQDLRRILSE